MTEPGHSASHEPQYGLLRVADTAHERAGACAGIQETEIIISMWWYDPWRKRHPLWVEPLRTPYTERKNYPAASARPAGRGEDMILFGRHRG